VPTLPFYHTHPSPPHHHHTHHHLQFPFTVPRFHCSRFIVARLVHTSAWVLCTGSPFASSAGCGLLPSLVLVLRALPRSARRLHRCLPAYLPPACAVLPFRLVALHAPRLRLPPATRGRAPPPTCALQFTPTHGSPHRFAPRIADFHVNCGYWFCVPSFAFGFCAPTRSAGFLPHAPACRSVGSAYAIFAHLWFFHLPRRARFGWVPRITWVYTTTTLLVLDSADSAVWIMDTVLRFGCRFTFGCALLPAPAHGSGLLRTLLLCLPLPYCSWLYHTQFYNHCLPWVPPPAAAFCHAPGYYLRSRSPACRCRVLRTRAVHRYGLNAVAVRTAMPLPWIRAQFVTYLPHLGFGWTLHLRTPLTHLQLHVPAAHLLGLDYWILQFACCSSPCLVPTSGFTCLPVPPVLPRFFWILLRSGLPGLPAPGFGFCVLPLRSTMGSATPPGSATTRAWIHPGSHLDSTAPPARWITFGLRLPALPGLPGCRGFTRLPLCRACLVRSPTHILRLDSGFLGSCLDYLLRLRHYRFWISFVRSGSFCTAKSYARIRTPLVYAFCRCCCRLVLRGSAWFLRIPLGYRCYGCLVLAVWFTGSTTLPVLPRAVATYRSCSSPGSAVTRSTPAATRLRTWMLHACARSAVLHTVQFCLRGCAITPRTTTYAPACHRLLPSIDEDATSMGANMAFLTRTRRDVVAAFTSCLPTCLSIPLRLVVATRCRRLLTACAPATTHRTLPPRC